MNTLFGDSLNHFRVLPLRVRYRADEDLQLPPYKGSTLRGAFGGTFRRILCSLPHEDCRACLLRETCPYPYVFETAPPQDSAALRNYESIPRPFVIEPPLEERGVYCAGDVLDFGLTLIGQAIDYLPYFVVTLRELGPVGIGVGRRRATLESVMSNASSEPFLVYSAVEGRVYKPRRVLAGEEITAAAARGSSLTPADMQSNLVLRFLTPVRLKSDERLTARPTFELVVRALLRRASSDSYFHHGQELKLDYRGIIAAAKEVRLVDADVRWVDWRRYSSRQKTKIAMGGFIGWTAYAGDIEPFLPLIALGRWLHLGKNVTFGLGQYEFGLVHLEGSG